MSCLSFVAIVLGLVGWIWAGRAIAEDKFPELTSRAPFLGVAGTGLTLNDIAAIVGIVVALATFLLNWYYQHQHFKLRKRLGCDDGKD
jgi:hypothetical protein